MNNTTAGILIRYFSGLEALSHHAAECCVSSKEEEYVGVRHVVFEFQDDSVISIPARLCEGGNAA